MGGGGKKKALVPTICPASLMLLAKLLVKPGSPPRLMMLPPLHSVAYPMPPTVFPPTISPASHQRRWAGGGT
jgi:hypothetical protein